MPPWSGSTTAPVSRRAVLTAFGVSGAAGILASCELGGSSRAHSPTDLLATWVRDRGRNYFIAHRGSGDVYPEHSLPAYQAALDWGARAMEISVDITSDGVLICMHDLTYDRTTTGHGLVAAQPSSILSGIGIRIPQLGPRWLRELLPALPLLRDALKLVGGRAVICIEAKADAAYEPMMALVETMGLRRSVVVKAYHTSSRIGQAQRAGFPVFGYLSDSDMSTDVISTFAVTLDPRRDYLGIPATVHFDDVTYQPDDLVALAVASGVPTWVYPVHRRADAAHYFARGVVGALSSSFGYTTSTKALMTADAWAVKAIASGEMTRSPDTAELAPSWTAADELTLSTTGQQQFITLGNLSPVAPAHASYRISFSARWTVLPDDLTSNFTLAFGHTDDTYYEHQRGVGDGYHAIMRPDGRVQLFRHDAGSAAGTLLGQTKTPPPVAGQWMTFELTVTPASIEWTRTGSGTTRITSSDRSYRGGYLHLGRSSAHGPGSVSFRALSVTAT
jgi:glycerophosphoryl diester phosphodiesterase